MVEYSEIGEEKMGIVPKETIEVTAQSIGITNLSPEAALMLAPDVEYRVREIMQVGYLFFFSSHVFVVLDLCEGIRSSYF